MIPNNLNWSKSFKEDWIGRIPECLERYPLGEVMIQELLGLHADTFNFNPAAITRQGWVAIDAPDNGGRLDDEKALIVEYAHVAGIDTLYATSKIELERADNHHVLLARLPQFTEKDLLNLQMGGWLFEPLGSCLKERNLYWDTWEESILFTIPLRFALIRLIDGYGHVTIAGEPDLIKMIKTRSLRLPEEGDLSSYDFFGQPLPEEHQKYVEHLKEKNCQYEWFDWPIKN